MTLKHKQRGAVLFLALMLMVVLTLLVLSAVRSGNTNLHIAGNMQQQAEGTAAAQQAIEQVVSADFTTITAASTVSVTNGSTAHNVAVAQPVCIGLFPLLNNDPSLPPGSTCITGNNNGNNGNLIVSASGVPPKAATSCYTQQWDVQATVLDNNSGATTTLHQGMSRKDKVTC